MTPRTTVLLVGVLALGAPLLAACTKPANNPNDVPYQVAPTPTPTPTPTPSPAPTPAPAATGQEVATNGLMAAAGTQLLVPLQQQSAPGAKQVGETLAGLLQAGQFIKTAVQLQPGKCYTGIGQGSGGTVQVEIVAQAGNLPMAQSQPAILSILGDKAGCFKHPGLPPLPIPVFFRVVAQGTGPVTAALYEK